MHKPILGRQKIVGLCGSQNIIFWVDFTFGPWDILWQVFSLSLINFKTSPPQLFAGLEISSSWKILIRNFDKLLFNTTLFKINEFSI